MSHLENDFFCSSPYPPRCPATWQLLFVVDPPPPVSALFAARSEPSVDGSSGNVLGALLTGAEGASSRCLRNVCW